MKIKYEKEDESVETIEHVETVEAKPKVKKEEVYEVRFSENRRFELHIGRRVFCFVPSESILLKKEDVESDDFKQVEKLFSVRRKEA